MCAKKYGSKSTNVARICQQILFQLKIAMGKRFSKMDWGWSWHTVCDISESYKPCLRCRIVKWLRPEENTWKLNTDGSFMAVQGRAGAGNIVRMINGHLVMAFATPIQFSTNNFSEAQAALQGTLWCCQQGFAELILELNSMLVVNMILGTTNIPWRLQRDIGKIQEKVTQHGIKVQHYNIVIGKKIMWQIPWPNMQQLWMMNACTSMKLTSLVKLEEQ